MTNQAKCPANCVWLGSNKHKNGSLKQSKDLNSNLKTRQK